VDFVVIGLGLSALALLTGLTLLCLVAPRWFRRAHAVQPGDSAYARAHAGERHALGQGFLCVGAVLLLATLGGISAGLADKAGAYLIASITTVAILSLLGGDVLYRQQHPIPHRRRAPSARTSGDADNAATTDPAVSPGASPTSVRRRVLPTRQPVAAAAQPAEAAPEAVEVMVADEIALGDELPQAEAPETVPDNAEPQIAGSSDEATEPQDHEATTEIGSPGETGIGPLEEPASAKPIAGETAEVPAVFPEPVLLERAKANGSADPSASAPGDEPDMVPNGDDRVIALFPTGAARRSRTIVAPSDPDGQS
jgi:hypothetical protein